jgi:hypothetical protein
MSYLSLPRHGGGSHAKQRRPARYDRLDLRLRHSHSRGCLKYPGSPPEKSMKPATFPARLTVNAADLPLDLGTHSPLVSYQPPRCGKNKSFVPSALRISG